MNDVLIACASFDQMPQRTGYHEFPQTLQLSPGNPSTLVETSDGRLESLLDVETTETTVSIPNTNDDRHAQHSSLIFVSSQHRFELLTDRTRMPVCSRPAASSLSLGQLFVSLSLLYRSTGPIRRYFKVTSSNKIERSRPISS